MGGTGNIFRVPSNIETHTAINRTSILQYYASETWDKKAIMVHPGIYRPINIVAKEMHKQIKFCYINSLYINTINIVYIQIKLNWKTYL